MKILMVSNTYTPIVGGIERSIQLFSDAFRRKGHEVLILAPEFDNMPEHDEGVVRIPALRNFNGSDFSVRLPIPISLFSELSRFKPDIVHAHHPFMLGDTALRIANKYNIPLVFTHHTKFEDYTHYVPLNSEAMKRFVVELSTGYANLADRVFAPSQSIKDLIISRGVETPVDVVPTGINGERFLKGDAEGFRKKWKIGPDDFLVGHIGRLAPEKNIIFLTQSIKQFLKENPHAKFFLGGYGPSLENVIAEFTRDNLSDRLIVTGVLQGAQLVDAFHAMDVFAFASKTETQGIVILEAMASGVPVVAIEASGIVDCVKNEINGFLVKESADEFVKAFKRVSLLSPQARKELKSNALKTAADFSIEKTTETALSIYKSLRKRDFVYSDYESSPWGKASAKIKTEWELFKNFAGSATTALSSNTGPTQNIEVNKAQKKKQIDKVLAKWLFKARRALNRNEWSAALLGLSKFQENESSVGLVMIQIDGFSMNQLKEALKNGKMPFLKKLLKNEHYKLYPFYSGLPSSTPAVQGELFYGTPQIVPAFSFYDRTSDKVFKMYDSENAQAIENRLKEKGRGLLENGSSYSNVYSGGAKESHFCAVSLGLNRIWRDVNPFKFSFFILTRFYSFVRILVLMAVEIIWAVLACIRGIFIGQNVLYELEFILTRIFICVWLRELVTLGARIDIARGLEIIHLNLLGFDEQAHRRGPSSKYAHQALRGIDSAVSAIFYAALNSTRRNYDVWIYSDHGQEDAVSYWSLYGKPVQDAVADVFREFKLSKASSIDRLSERGVQLSRLNYLNTRYSQMEFSAPLTESKENIEHTIIVTAIGPTGNIYLSYRITLEEKFSFAKKLVESAKIPMVLVPLSFAQAKAFTVRGEFTLPEQAKEVLGEHPYLNEVTQDLIDLCHHPDAGDFTFSGWRLDDKPMTFPVESGAHAGPGTEETNAFALLPADIYMTTRKDDSIRTQDLRSAALRFLDRTKEEPAAYTYSPLEKIRTPVKSIRLMTYNVHSCVGFDGKISPERIARVIGRHDPDIVALQELDMNRLRTGRIDQPHLIAKKLQMMCHFHPSFQIEEEHYGNAILSRFPMEVIYAGALPGIKSKPKLEPRGAIWTSIKINDTSLQFVNTHLGLHKNERVNQVEALLSETWLSHPQCRGPVVLCGDFNAIPNSVPYKLLGKKLLDAQRELEFHKPKATWFSPYPLGRIDHVFISSEIKILNVQVPCSSLDKIASDHLPLIVDIEIRLNETEIKSKEI